MRPTGCMERFRQVLDRIALAGLRGLLGSFLDDWVISPPSGADVRGPPVPAPAPGAIVGYSPRTTRRRLARRPRPTRNWTTKAAVPLLLPLGSEPSLLATPEPRLVITRLDPCIERSSC